MIITLCVADFLFHSGVMLTSYSIYLPIQTTGLVFSDIFLRFSVFWSSCIAILLYKLLSRDKDARAQQYYKCSLCIVLSLSLILGFIILCCKRVLEIREESRKILIVGISNATFVISLFLTLFFYAKSIRILKGDNTTFTSEATRESIRTLYRYAFVQLFTVGPKVVYSYYSALSNAAPNIELDTALYILTGLTGFANSMVYFFKRDGFGATQDASINMNESTASDLSYYEDPDDMQFRISHGR